MYKSTNGGQNWKCINGDYPENEISRVIREDPVTPGLLFVGSETGIFISTNDGKNWQKLQGNFPVVPVYDMKIKQDDLVVGTHGRSFWILDDLTPLRQYSSKFFQKGKDKVGAVKLFPPKDTYRYTLNWSVNFFLGEGKNYSTAFGLPGTFYEGKTTEGEKYSRNLDIGENPPQGVIVNYYLESEKQNPFELLILDEAGNEIERFESKNSDKKQTVKSLDETDDIDDEQKKANLPNKPGFNRFVWNIHYPGPEIKIAKSLERKGYKPLGRGEGGPGGGPVAPPGNYQVCLKLDGKEYKHSFKILKDPRLETTSEDFAAQFELWNKITRRVSEINGAINSIRRIMCQIEELLSRATFGNSISQKSVKEVRKNAEKLLGKLKILENELIQTKNETPSDRLRHPAMLKERMEALVSTVSVADSVPPRQVYDVFEHLSKQIDDKLELLNLVCEQDLSSLNLLIDNAGIPKLHG